MLKKSPEEKPQGGFPVSLCVLVAANFVPLYGVLAWGWAVFPLLVLFWMENVIIGALNAARMLLVDPADPALWLAKLFMVPFFCVHYGFFTMIHGGFVFSPLFGGQDYRVDYFDVLEPARRAAGEFNLWLPVAVLAGSHLFSFLWNYLYRGEYRRAALSELMTNPYKRVVILHLTIIFGGMAVMALGSPVWSLVMLVGTKIALDVAAHRREHRISA
jgi:hypothetical protein